MLLNRYLIREILLWFGAVQLLLLLTYASSRFVQYLATAAAGKIDSGLIFELLALKMVTSLVLMLPLCHYISVYVALNRLSRDNELIAIASLGLGSRFLFDTAARLAFAVALVVAILALAVAPWAEARLGEVENRAKSESDLTGITPGQFKDFNEGNRILYVERLSSDKRGMSNVFLQGRQDGHLGVLSADRAEIELDQKTGSRYVNFYAGRRYMGSPGRLDYSIVEYEKYGVRIDRSEAADRSARVSAASTASLWSADTPEAAAELQWRIAMPISTVLLTLLAVVLVRAASDQNRILGLLSAVLIYFTYSNLLGIAKTLAMQGAVPVYPGLWWVHALLVLVILALLGEPLLRKRWARRQRATTLPQPS